MGTFGELVGAGGLLQLGLHAVEGGDVSQLLAQRLFAGEAHGEEHEAIAGHAVGEILPRRTLDIE